MFPAKFLSTLPARGATFQNYQALDTSMISIHAPREGSDDRPQDLVFLVPVFLSTLPARGAT